LTFLAKGLATVLGAGFFPVAPGTFASLLAALGFKFVFSGFSPIPYASLVTGVILLGIWASSRTARHIGQKDPRRVVIDEVAGQLVALAAAPAGWAWVAAGFVFFRLFDILKPFPIRRLENLPGGWGIMADDVLAGLYAALLLQAWLWVR
jgi:phosphatidylglycerophosphatase A